MDEPVRLILRWLLFPLFLLLILYLFSTGISAYVISMDAASPKVVEIADHLRTDVSSAAFEIWQFVRPLLQLGVILLIIYSFIRALGIDLGLKALPQAISIQAILAFFVIGGFTIASLLSSDPAGSLRDLALVVVGFYFGTKAKDSERDGTDGQPRSPRQPEGPTSAETPTHLAKDVGTHSAEGAVLRFDSGPRGRNESFEDGQKHFLKGFDRQQLEDAPNGQNERPANPYLAEPRRDAPAKTYEGESAADIRRRMQEMPSNRPTGSPKRSGS